MNKNENAARGGEKIPASRGVYIKFSTNLNLRLLSKFLRLYDKTRTESYCIILLEK